MEPTAAPEPAPTCTALACNAGGPANRGGHVFEEPADPTEPAVCRCGMDEITWTCWFAGY